MVMLGIKIASAMALVGAICFTLIKRRRRHLAVQQEIADMVREYKETGRLSDADE